MSTNPQRLIPSIVKKYLMAITGLVLSLFVLGHMVGNLQYFMGPDVINAYALELHSLPFHLLWVIRAFLATCLVVHVIMAVLLVQENRAARGGAAYEGATHKAATWSAKLMPVSGVILLVYVVFHLLHFTLRVGPGEYAQDIGDAHFMLHGEMVHFFDVYAMMFVGFKHIGTSLFYILAVGMLCMHLSHGVASMFQSLGFRNETTRYKFEKFALAYGWIVFLGFASIPASVLVLGTGSEYVNEKAVNEADDAFFDSLPVDLND